MIFISYSQNHEDVMLFRALRDVERGFYIDVGAQDPTIDSVTRAFYERGWRGINIEPNEEFFRKLEQDRPHDTNLCTAVGNEAGTIAFHEVINTGLSTTNAEYARRHGESGYQVRSREVPCTTLDQICTDHGVSLVHFLKIDVEGSERAVLQGFSFGEIRPWILIVEATEPNSTREVFSDWEDLIVAHDYEFVYFDGLNRFYLAREHEHLKKHFSSPPNPFDQYVSYRLWRTNADLDEMRALERSALVNTISHMLSEMRRLQNEVAEAQSLRSSLQVQAAELARAAAGLAATQERLRALKSSASWRLTRPLREIRRALARLRPFVLGRLGKNRPAAVGREAPDEAALGLTEPARTVYWKLLGRD